MKKTIISIIFSAVAIFGYAQTSYDALLFSENNYEGTARSVAMGNAFTALGGDLGSIALNPAGSAVASYSQASITPSLTFSTNLAKGVSPFSDGSLPYFQKARKSSITRFDIPNISMSFNWDTGRKSGLKSLSFGFIVNKSASYDQDVYANGVNSTTSFMGQMAAEASELAYSGSKLGQQDAWDFMPWKMVAGYQSGMISTYGGYDDLFIGASEIFLDNDEIAVGGPLDQIYSRQVSGGKYDYIFNLGANISDFLYLGANIGVSSLDYDYNEYFKEAAVEPGDFEIGFDDGSYAYFENMKYNYSYRASGTGLYAKLGFIVTPAAGLRIGASIQTPTLTTIDEEWRISASTQFSDNKMSASATSPYGEYRYNLRSPMRADFGIAYTFGSLGVLSMDYEVCDYSGMRFSSNDREEFDAVNEDIRNRFGKSHSLRAGIEVKPLSCLAVRGGYNMTSSAEKTDAWGERLETSYTQNVSAGIGYSSKKSFFADLAVRRTFLPDEYFMPYDDYIYDSEGYVSVPVPEILNQQKLWKVMLTLGWRF